METEILNIDAWEQATPKHLPFTHCIIEQGLNAAYFDNLANGISAIPDENFETHVTGYRYATLLDIPFLRLLYSPAFLKRLSHIFGRPLHPSVAYPYAQAYVFPPNSRGLPPHTDGADPRDVAVLFYMARDWRPGVGGELNILDASESPLALVEAVAPKPNTVACIELSSTAWHSVTPTYCGWRRQTIVADYDFV